MDFLNRAFAFLKCPKILVYMVIWDVLDVVVKSGRKLVITRFWVL
jgi:hypothetical protein